jgi:hypothetical protein
MKKLIPIFLFAALLAVSCDKADNTPQEYTIKIDGVEVPANAVVAAHAGNYTVVESPVMNGGFELILPSTLPESSLFPVSEADVTKGAVASDSAAKLAFLNLEITPTGWIDFDDSHLHENIGVTKQAVFIYADRPVKLSGVAAWTSLEVIGVYPTAAPEEVEYTAVYHDLSLNAGWNRVCGASQIISTEPLKVQNTFSNKSLDDCKWNIYVFAPGTYNPLPTDRWEPEE